jgi:CDGSH-type Zn-finger protein
MDDSSNSTAKSLNWSDPDQLAPNPEFSPNLDGLTAPETEAKKPETTDEKALDRWFLEQRGSKRVPKRLEVANELLVTSGGPLKMTGNITLINEDGNVTHANNLSLCRCGASKSKPFCDDQHLEIEFFDGGSLTQMSDWMPVTRPQTITVTCVKNGPLKFRGYLRIYNKKGQECITMSGALCRCGKSSKKPFCDNKQSCSGNC